MYGEAHQEKKKKKQKRNVGDSGSKRQELLI
jgi:hypothetical protein